MIESMAKIEIVGLFDELDRTLDLLQQIGIVQIDEIPTIEDTRHTHIRRIHLDETKEHLLARYEELSVTVSEILDIMREGDVEEVPLDVKTRDELQKLSLDELIKHIAHITREIRRLARQRKNLLQDIEITRQYEALINTFLPLLEKAGPSGELEQIGIILEHGESSVLSILKNRLEEITGPEMMFFHNKMSDDRTGVFIVVTQDDLPVVRQLLSNEGVAEYHIPREFRKKNFRESIETIRNRIDDIPREIEKIDRQLMEAKSLTPRFSVLSMLSAPID